MSETYIQNTTAIDWLTITSYEDEVAAFWKKRMQEMDDVQERKIMQYEGWMSKSSQGSLFFGSAYQSHKLHHMIRISGQLADELKGLVFAQVKQGTVKCTRLDLQITTQIEPSWSQWDYMVRMKSKGKNTGWIESSQGGHYETVYIGSRTSDRFHRIYIKEAQEPRMLRVETEYKGARSDKVARLLSYGRSTPNQIMLSELQSTLRDEKLSAIYEPLLSGITPMKPVVVRKSTIEKTESWLVEQVLPSFTRVINSEESNGSALEAFIAVINEALDRY